MNNSKIRFTYGLFLALFSFLTIGFFPGDPPGGKTGAPGDGLCTDCHNPSNPLGLDGEISILNFPSTITPGQTYMLTASVTNPNGLAVRAGFQALVLDGSNENAGDLSSASANPATQTIGTREYIEHRPAINFPASNQVSWDFMWTAPNAPGGTGMTIYASTVIASGTAGNSQDRIVTTQANGVMETVVDPLVINSISTTDVLCFGGSTGVAIADVTGGSGGNNFQWSNGVNGPSNIANGFTAGTHSVTVTDSNGDMASTTFSINQPGSPLILSVVSQTDIDCNTTLGAVTVQASGGTPGYTYNWSNGSTNPTQNALLAGSYTATVIDQNLCEATLSVTINADTNIPLADAGPDQLLTCNITQVTLDGTGSSTGINISYAWFDNNGVLIANTITTTVSLPGFYALVVTNNENGCLAESVVQVNEAANVTLNISGVNPSCPGLSDGSIDLTINGQSPYLFDWNVNALDGIEDPTNLAAGFYSVTVTDANGCTGDISITLSDPAALTLAEEITNVSCAGSCNGLIDVTVTGGTGNLIYSWTPAISDTNIASDLCPGTYILVVTDDAGCTAEETYIITEPDSLVISGVTNNVSCTGFCDGAISVTVTGGAGGYLFDWANGAVGPLINNLCPGIHTVTVTDANGCTASTEFIITEPALLVVDAVATDVTCNGDCDGTITLTATGGTMPYDYNWSASSGINSPILENGCPGVYSVTITDANDCSVIAEATINEPAALEADIILDSGISCAGICDGSLEVLVVGGTGPFSYDWDNLPDLATQTNICAGTYELIVTDANGCSAVDQFTITEPTELTLSGTTSDVSCFGLADGSINTSVTGGTGVYIYDWDDNTLDDIADPTNLEPGGYSLTVTDENGCTSAMQWTITEPAQLSVSINSTGETASNANDGTAQATPGGGTSGYSYLWSNADTDASIMNLPPGNYTVTVTDANNCTVTGSTTVSSFDCNLTVSLTGQDISCNGLTDGMVATTVENGTAPITYAWSNNTNEANIMGVEAGTYSVTVMDGSNCEVVSSITLSEPTELNAAADVTPVSCAGDCDGEIELTISGGTSPFDISPMQLINLCAGSYAITITDANDCSFEIAVAVPENAPLNLSMNSTPVTTLNGNDGTASAEVSGGTGSGYFHQWSNNETSSTITGLAAGEYCVTVTDANDCWITDCVLVSNVSCNLEAEVVTTSVACAGENNGSAEVTSIIGGEEPFTYAWSSSSNDSSLETALGPGNYQVTVTDGVGCSVVNAFTISEPDELTLELTKVDESAAGASDGQASAEATGGTGVLTYAWNTLATGPILTGLPAGEYCVTVSDANNCQISDCIIVIEGACALEATVATTPVSCFDGGDGTAIVTPLSAVDPVFYVWSSSMNDTNEETGLSAGTYNVTVSDGAGCGIEVPFVIESPTEMVMPLLVEHESAVGANDGSVTTQLSGGTAPYIYEWNVPHAGQPALFDLAPGEYCVTAIDANNCQVVSCATVNAGNCTWEATVTTTPVICFGDADGTATVIISGTTNAISYDWSTSANTTNEETGLAAGTYNVTVSDGMGCGFEIPFIIESPTPITLTLEVTDVSAPGANDGAVNTMVSGGSGNYDYDWNVSNAGQPGLSDLAPGEYCVTVTDELGCTAANCATVNEAGCDLELVNIVAQGSCEDLCDGAINLEVSGGVEPLVYSWNDSNIGNVQNPIGLCAGTYTVTITDANDCEAVTSVAVELFEFTLEVDAINAVNCEDQCDATITLNAMGTPPYNYDWSDDTYDGMSMITDLCAGTYACTVTDDNGCIETFETSWTQPASMMVTVDTENSCFEECTGSYTPVVTGGTPPYSFLVTGTSNPPGEICPGTYSLTVTGANGCTAETTFVIEEYDAIVLTVDEIGNELFEDGFINITVTGGSGDFSYLWEKDGQFVSSEMDPQNLTFGDYIVIILDNVTECALVSENIFVDLVEGTKGVAEQSLLIFPNPTSNHLTISAKDGSSLNSGIEKLQIFDSRGKSMNVLAAAESNANVGKIHLDMSRYPTGVYLLMYQFEDKVQVAKVMVIEE